MTDVPEGIALDRHRDLNGPGFNRPVRYVLLSLVGAVIVLGLFNAFGQRPTGTTAHAAAASLELYVPSRVRGGVFYEARFTIDAHRDLGRAILELSPGWNEGMQMNTIEPVPFGQSSRNGDLLFTLGHVPAGHIYRLFLEFQVNATNVAWHRRADVTLYDGGTRLLTIHHTVTVFP